MFLFFIFSEHLLVMNFSLILTSILFSVVIYCQASTAWLAYLLIMVFLSGLMVLFIYMTSLSSNEPFYFSFTSLFCLFLFNLGFPLVLWVLSPSGLTPLSLNLVKNYSSSFVLELVNKTYSLMSSDFTVVMIIYLFITLIVTVKVSSFMSGPLKQVV
uniref:NADH dehydrogenase subunit 6 n=1 Tax=Grandidierella japonica TaxID=429032 RepID=A0A5H2XW25_GRAJA|nr:NADH dehydrogenase subunit 6 [Grandidierella japonica]